MPLMRFMETGIAGAKIIDPSPHQDERGRFLRAWCAREFADHGLDFLPVQANFGFSVKKGTVRGMHFQHAPATEAKLVRCTRGAIFDAVLDLRPESPSYGEWYGVVLTLLSQLKQKSLEYQGAPSKVSTTGRVRRPERFGLLR